MKDQATLAVYSREALAYAEYESGDGDWALMDRFIARLPRGGAVLDLGCGPGHSSMRLAECGFVVTSIDGSSGMAEEAARRFGLEVRVLTFDALDYEATFDGIWAAWSLHHAPHDQIAGIMGKVVRSLRAGGVLLMTVKSGSGERRDNLDRFYAYYDEPLIRRILGEAGFDIEHLESGNSIGFDGEPCGTLAVIARLKG